MVAAPTQPSRARGREEIVAIRFTEMVPAPEQCWLRDPEGNRYVSELRLVAVGPR
jgi:hypothetical protein